MLPRSGRASVRYHRSSEIFSLRKFSTSGVSGSAAVQWTNQLRLQGSASHSDAIYYAENPFQGRSTRASIDVVYQPSEKWNETVGLTYANFDREQDGRRLYDYGILRSRTSFQANQYLLFRAIFEYNSYRRRLLADLLGSFTYIPGTVVHLGYGSLHERLVDEPTERGAARQFREMQRGFFFKASYLWRL